MDIAGSILKTAVRVVVLGLLKRWTVQDLRFAIKHDASLAAALKVDDAHYAKLRSIAGSSPNWVNIFTVAYTLEWVETRRPDLYEPLNTVEGRAWLERNIEGIKRAIWSPTPEPLTEEERAKLTAMKEDYERNSPLNVDSLLMDV